MEAKKEGKGEHQGPSTLNKVVKTIFLVLVWVCLGLYLEISGPTLKDLKLRVDANYETVSRAVSGRSFGYFLGSAVGGFLVDKLDPFCDLMIAICLDLGAAATIVAPHSTTTGLLWFLFVMQGTFEGVINIAGQKLILEIWLEKASSPMHALHLGFGIGSFIVPQIANPFLAVPAPTLSPVLNTSHTNTSMFDFSDVTTLTYRHENTTVRREFIKESRIEWPYLIVAVITICLSFVFYYYQFCGKSSRNRAETSDKEKAQAKSIKQILDPGSCTNGDRVFGVQIFLLLFFYFFNAVGGERTYGKFIRSFAIDHLDFDGDTASLLNTSFWISFSLGRFLGFLAAKWIPIRILVLIEVTGALLTSVLLNIFAHDDATMLWVFTQPMGIFIAPCFPSGIGWGDNHVKMTGLAITFLLLGGALGGVAYMFAIGYFYDTFGPKAFLYQCAAYGVLLCFFAYAMHFAGRGRGDRFLRSKEEMYVKETNTTYSENDYVQGDPWTTDDDKKNTENDHEKFSSHM